MKKYTVELTEEQLKQLGIEPEKKSPFDRVDKCKYYYISEVGNICSYIDEDDEDDKRLHKVANYCTDINLIEQRDFQEALNRLLWRFTWENGWNNEMWEDSEKRKSFIYFDYDTKDFRLDDIWTMPDVGSIYFVDNKTAQRAIDEIVKPFMEDHPDFKI